MLVLYFISIPWCPQQPDDTTCPGCHWSWDEKSHGVHLPFVFTCLGPNAGLPHWWGVGSLEWLSCLIRAGPSKSPPITYRFKRPQVNVYLEQNGNVIAPLDWARENPCPGGVPLPLAMIPPYLPKNQKNPTVPQASGGSLCLVAEKQQHLRMHSWLQRKYPPLGWVQEPTQAALPKSEEKSVTWTVN